MGVLQDFERRLEGAVEGFFARAFRSGIQPVELAKALQRYAKDEQKVAEDGVVVPNVFLITVGPKDRDRLIGYGASLPRELGEVVVRTAAERGWTLRGPVKVRIRVDADLPLGRFRLAGRVERADGLGGGAATFDPYGAPAMAPVPAPEPLATVAPPPPVAPPVGLPPVGIPPVTPIPSAPAPAVPAAEPWGAPAPAAWDAPAPAEPVPAAAPWTPAPAAWGSAGDGWADAPAADASDAAMSADPSDGEDWAEAADEVDEWAEPQADAEGVGTAPFDAPEPWRPESAATGWADAPSAPSVPAPADVWGAPAPVAPVAPLAPAEPLAPAAPWSAPALAPPWSAAPAEAPSGIDRTQVVSSVPVAHLAVLLRSGDDGGRRLLLTGSRLTVGRSPSNDLIISDTTVSREHAVFVLRGDTWWIVDMGSTNGTRVNGLRAAEQPLGPGDRIEFGEVVAELVEG